VAGPARKDRPMPEPLSTRSFPPHAIAIIGLAGRFPGAKSLDEFWQNIRNGVESLETFSDTELDLAGVSAALRSDPLFIRKGAKLDGVELFDAGFFGLSPREAQIVDPQHRIILECAWEALEHAGYPAGVNEASVGVYAGAGMNTYLIEQILRDPALADAVGSYQLMIGNDKDFLCTRVSYKLNLRGPSMAVQTACSTSLVAVHVACRALQRGECDLALAGGVSVQFPQNAGYLVDEGMILSPDGHCRPFDADADGTRPSAGAGIVVLKRLSEAMADRDTVHAVILGTAINNDGAGKAGFTAPSVDGQVEAITIAQTLAGVNPRSISYVETHGTGTALGDPIEIAALTEVFRASTPDVGFCHLGSLKASVGHLDAAAGIGGLIKTALALRNRELPPLVNFRSPNPRLELETSPFAASGVVSAWTSDSGPRRAGVSSFGIGGTNAHAVLEEAPLAAPSIALRDHHLLVLSARTPAALEQSTANLADWLEGHDDMAMPDVEFTLQVGRKAFTHRRALVVRDLAQALKVLRQPQQAPALTAVHDGGVRPVAFLFSGQGSQHVGMGAALYRTEAVYRDAIDRCATLLEPHLGRDVRSVIFANDKDRSLDETRFTQPALFCIEYALATLWMQWGVAPRAMLGHSLGEYVAAHFAGVMSLRDALALVAARGRLIQEMAPGSMAAVHLPAAELRHWLDGGVDIAAVNAPGLCTITGPAAAITAVLSRLAASDIDCRELHTSHAFHSWMMEPALERFVAAFQGVTLSPPSIPYISNVTGTWITPEQATSPTYYAKHLRQPVQFEAGMRSLAAVSGLFFLEIGPGDTLTSLARANLARDRAKHATSSLSHPRKPQPDAQVMLEAAARLWLAGATLEWSGLHAGSAARRVPLPTYPFERQRYWVDSVPRATQPAGDHVPDHGKTGEHLYVPTWTRDDSLSGATLHLHGAWLVLGEADPLADAVIARLRATGADPIFVEAGDDFRVLGPTRFRVRLGVADDIAALARKVGGPRSIAGAVFLWGVEYRIGEFVTSTASCYQALVALAEGLDTWERDPPVRIIVASAGAQSVLDEPVRRPDAAVSFGPVLVLPTEVQGLRMRSVDLDLPNGMIDSDAASRMLVEEAASADEEAFVARRGERRWVRRYERLAPRATDATALPLKQRGIYLITGGLGGIGLKLAGWLAGTVSARLLLTARRPLPPREDWEALLARPGSSDWSLPVIRSIREIEAAGGEVITAAADAADLTAMTKAIDSARLRWGPLDGVIHSAGVPGTGRLAFLKEMKEVRDVLSPKLAGLDVLVRLLGDTPLDFVALMSSINSVVGNPGACDYASASAALDSFVESALKPAAWCRVLAINWDAWRDVGMAANLPVPEAMRAERAAFLRAAIDPAIGVSIFGRILASRHHRVVVTTQDLNHAIEASRASEAAQWDQSLASTRSTSASSSPSAASNVPVLPSREDRSSVFEAPATDIERSLAKIWTEVTGVADIGVHDDFFELGGHSLMATRVIARASVALGVRLKLRDIFDAPTIRRLAERIGAAAPADAHAKPGKTDDREEMLL
jgi:phthiocerol/phenolphthiocerol synthesis type-I polyketide synthase E